MVDYITEILVDGSWVNITPDVRDSSPIVLERGRRDWATDTDPSTCSLRLNNGASRAAAGVQGRYSPRNPRSDLYGKIGRNTPIRVREDRDREAFMVLPGFESSYATTPDVAALDITGDLVIRFDMEPTTWRPAGGFGLAKKYVTTSDQRSWALWLNADGTLSFRWSPDGTFAASITAVSDAAVPSTSTRVSIRVSLDVNNGAGGNDVVFSTAESIDGTYTQLGTTITTAGVTSVFASTAPLEIGRVSPLGISAVDPLQGIVYAVRLLDAGVSVANPDFTLHEPNVRTFTDDVGRVWTLTASAALADERIRFTGEAKSWPQEWDLSGADRWVNLTAAGMTRRLQQGTKPTKSSLFRDLSIKDDIVAYWPLEEPKGATRFAAGRVDDNSFLIPESTTGGVTFAGDDETFFASDHLPTLKTGIIRGNVPLYTADADQRFVFLISIPEDVTWATEKILARVNTTGTTKQWVISKDAADNMRVRAFDSDGTEVLNSAFVMNLFGTPAALSLWLQQSGADIDWQVAKFPLDSTTATSFGATLAAFTYGRMSRVTLGDAAADLESTTVGHAFILNDDVQSIWDTVNNSMIGWSGETGLSRLVRLSNDDGLPAVRAQSADDAETMGYQRIETIMDLFREVPAADLGMLTDRPDAIGVQYRSRIDLYSQDPALILDYANGVIADPFRPVEDDQALINEVTVERPRGSSATAADTTGPLSSLDPPNGVGKYDVEQEVNIDTDERLEDQAFWRLHLGTVDEARFPEVTLNLRNERVAAMETQILAVREGDIIRIDNPPEWLPGGPYSLLVEGIHEEKSAVEHEITFNCSPGSAWDVFMLDDAEFGRLDTGGSQVVGTLTAAQTSFGVVTDAGSQHWIPEDLGLALPGVVGSYASTPDAAALDITGSIEIRAEVRRDSWSDIDSTETFVAKWGLTGNQRAYQLVILSGGFLQFQWSVTGATALTETSSVPVPLLTGGRVAVKATRNSATGDVTFYYSDTIDGTYQQLGDVQASAPSAIFASTAGLAVGQRLATNANAWDGDIYRARVYNGIAGTVVANPDFTAQAEGTGSFTDSAALTWTVVGDGRVQAADPFDILVAGEVMRVAAINDNITNASFETDGAWTLVGDIASITQSTFAAALLEGEFSVAVTANGAPASSTSGIRLDMTPIAPGQWVALRIPVRPGGAIPSPSGRARIEFRNAAGGAISSVTTARTALTAFAYNFLTLQGQAPAGTVSIRVFLFLADAATDVPLANSMVNTDAWAVSTGLTQAEATDSVAGGYGQQFMTVQRAVNGVAKTHTSGADIVLAKPFTLSL